MSATQPQQSATSSASLPMLAYTYTYGITAPAKALPDLMARQQKACSDAGPMTCQVTASSVTQNGEANIEGSVTMQATPAWITAFRLRIGSDAKGAGGSVSQSSVESEDLTRQIVDSEAVVRAKTTLRDRLQSLLESRPGKVSDLVDVEQALSKVQGELDSTQSELALMRSRVATSVVTINYGTHSMMVGPEETWDPLKRAVSDLGLTFAGTLGFMITLTVALVPWAPVVALLIWLVRKPLAGLRKRGPKTTSEPPKSA